MRTTPRKDDAFDLAMIGWGTRGVDQITVEQLRYLSRARDIVVDPGATPDIFALLEQYPGKVHDIGPMYRDGTPVTDLYPAMAEYSLDLAQRRGSTVAMSYGHPLVYAKPCSIMIRECKRRGLRLRICAGISSIDEIMCQLELDIGDRDLQIVYARNLLDRERRIDPSIDLLLMQPAGVGEDVILRDPTARKQRDVGAFDELQRRLLEAFGDQHRITSVCLSDEAGDAHEVEDFLVCEVMSRARGIHYGHTWFVEALGAAVAGSVVQDERAGCH